MRLALENNRRSVSAASFWLVCLLMAVALWVGLGSGAHAKQRTLSIVVLGDSLTAGYGLPAAQAFPAQLEAALRARGHSVSLVNAGVSGDTTAAGLQRLDWAVPAGTDGVVLELGANDALRGLPPATARQNLTAILDRLKARNIPVLVAGMRAPGNWGQEYASAFDRIFPDLARQYSHELYPFFLEGVAVRKELNQPDGLHPTAKGVAEIVRRFLPVMEQFISRIRAGDRKG